MVIIDDDDMSADRTVTGRGDDEKVNHPSHYGGIDNPFETIKVLRAWLTPEQYVGFCRGNAIKYQSRAGKKGDLIEDLKKANWYQNEEIKFRKDTGYDG